MKKQKPHRIVVEQALDHIRQLEQQQSASTSPGRSDDWFTQKHGQMLAGRPEPVFH